MLLYNFGFCSSGPWVIQASDLLRVDHQKNLGLLVIFLRF